MKSSYNNKKVNQNQSYQKGIWDSSYTMIAIFTYVLCRYGYKSAKIQQMLNSVQDVADSITKGYITLKDIEQVMIDEFDIRLRDTSSDTSTDI